jgi:hypothetical protein
VFIGIVHSKGGAFGQGISRFVQRIVRSFLGCLAMQKENEWLISAKTMGVRWQFGGAGSS